MAPVEPAGTSPEMYELEAQWGPKTPWTTGARHDAITECVRCSTGPRRARKRVHRPGVPERVCAAAAARRWRGVWYLRGHLGQRFASTATVAPKTVAFVAGIEKFVAAQGVDLVSFGKHQRKDDITLQYLQQFDADEGVLYVGRAQEKARVVRTERRRCARTGMSYPGSSKAARWSTTTTSTAWTTTSARSS